MRMRFTGSHSRDVLKGVPGSHEDDWQRGRLIEGKIRRNAAHVPGSRERVSGKTKCGDPKDAVAWLDMRNFGADRGDDARHFIAEDARIGRLAGIEGKRLENITKIHSGGFYFDQHLPGLAGVASGREQNAACRDALVRASPVVVGLRSRAIAPRAGARGQVAWHNGLLRERRSRARHRNAAIPPRARFRPVARPRAADRLRGRRSSECSLHITRSNPMAGACAGTMAFMSRPDRLRAARDHIDTELCRWSGEFDCLGQLEQRTGAHQHWIAFPRLVQGPKIDDTFGSFAGTNFHKLLPILSSVRPQREAILSFGSELRSTAGDTTSHTRRAKALGQPHPEPLIVRENEP